MAIIRYADPFKEMEELMDRFWRGGTRDAQPSLETPVADVYTEGKEDKERLVVEAHLPGFSQEDVEVDIHEGALEIRAGHIEKEEKGDKKRKYVVRESSSSFYRRIGLPKNVSTDDVEADFQDGVLKIAVPFKELPKPQKVKIGGKKK